MATKVTTGLISADAALVDLNIDANTLYVDASADRVGMGTTSPASALHVKGDEVQIEDPGGGFKLHLNADTNPIKIIANDNTGANYCGFKLQTNNGGAYPVTAMDVYPHGAASVAFGAGARTDTQMLISRAPTSASQTTPETLLVLSTPCTSTSSNIPVGQGPRIVFEIPDDQSGNKATGAAIAAIKEVDADSNSQTSLAFYTSGDDETLDQNMTILSDGKVGIGESSPDLKLHVKSSGQIAKLETTATTGDCILTFADAAANKGYVGFGSSSSEIFQITNIENGDMKFDTNNTERMRITSSGNVGIGTNAPTELLQVFGNTSSALDIGTDNSAEVVAEFIPDSTNARNGRLRIAGTNSPENNSVALISDASTNVGMAFVTVGSGTKNENMMIHSTGVIQMPKQASFLAIYPAATAGGSNSIIIFGGEQHDEGGNYNQSNGRFTAPVAGKYFFTVSILLDPENTGTAYYARLAFGVNGTTSAVYGDSLNTAFACDAGSSTTVSSYQSVSMSTNLNLAAGDYVTVHNAGTSPTYGTGYGSFGGFLIG